MERYDIASIVSSTSCPSLCKLRDPPSMCKEDMMEFPLAETGSRVFTTSPMYNCKRNYPRSYICIYNISMSCGNNHVRVQPLDIDLADNDFVQVIDHTRGHHYPPVSGSTWPATLMNIPSSQFAMVFWSDKDRTQGRGFRLKLACQSSTEEFIGAGFGATVF